jgi:membrane protease YdiL (CAAX protease family)
MENSILETDQHLKDKRHSIVAWALLGGLLLLRLPFLAGMALSTYADWLYPVFDVGTYLLTACLIWWERERLADFHIDGLALWIVILFKPIQTLLLALWFPPVGPFAFPSLPSLSFWIISLGLVLALKLSHAPWPRITKASWKWFGIGVLVGFIAILITAYPTSLELDASQLQEKPGLFFFLVIAPRDFLYQLGYAAVTEEPLFRGFLWGFLFKAGWKPVWICLFQAGLFMLGHIYYVTQLPLSFWIIVPVGGLVLGALVWRSKTLASSLAAHAAMNALGLPIAYILVAIIK